VETGGTPGIHMQDAAGNKVTRIPRLCYPVNEKGQSIILHGLTYFSKEAVYQPFEEMMEKGKVRELFGASSAFRPQYEVSEELQLKFGREKIPVIGLEKWVRKAVAPADTFVLQWADAAIDHSQQQPCASLPEYYRWSGKEAAALGPSEVPESIRAQPAVFAAKQAANPSTYTSSLDRGGAWTKPGPSAGPFAVTLSDGSTVTYYWYRFIDQPTLQNAEMSEAEKKRLQVVAEEIQRNWTAEKQYLPEPTQGTLAALDGALLVTPPTGLEVGYVPIAVSQQQ